MTLPAPIFIGFFPKVTQLRPEWLEVASVREIGSVSNCISKAPTDWIQYWKHNEFGFYDLEATARSIIGDDSIQYDMYAYEMFPVRCLERKIQAVEVDIQNGTVPNDFEFLGYDVVTKSVSDFFECSPLSCNHAARDFAVNSYCLIDDETQAYHAWLEMSEPGARVEPGPYYLFKVYRKKRT